MLRESLPTRISLVLLLVAFLASCAPSSQQAPLEGYEKLEAMAATAEAEDAFDIGQLAPVLHLAVEIEVTAEGVRPIGVSIVRGPDKSSSALADLLVTARAGDEVFAEYTIPDPRLAEVDSEGQRTLTRAPTFVFVPLSAVLAEPELKLEIVPVPGREEFVSEGGTLDLVPLVTRACKARPELEECQKIFQEQRRLLRIAPSQ